MRASPVEEGPAFPVAQPLIVEHKVADLARKLRTLPPALGTAGVAAIVWIRRCTDSPDGIRGRAGLMGVGSLVAETDLLQERDQVIHKVLLDDLSVVPQGDRVEIDFEGFPSRRNLGSVGRLHRSLHGAPEARD